MGSRSSIVLFLVAFLSGSAILFLFQQQQQQPSTISSSHSSLSFTSSSPSSTNVVQDNQIKVTPSSIHSRLNSTLTTSVPSSFSHSLSPSLSNFKLLLKQWDLDSVFPLLSNSTKNRASSSTNEPFQPVSSSSSFCPNSSPTSINDDVYEGCRLPGINNVLYTQHTKWFCIYDGRHVKSESNKAASSSYLFRDRFCNKGTSEKMRYSSLLQIRYDKLFLGEKKQNYNSHQPHDVWVDDENGKALVSGQSDGDEGGNTLLKDLVVKSVSAIWKRNQNSFFQDEKTSKLGLQHQYSACWSDIVAAKQKQIPSCGWMDVPSFYFTEKFWEARRLVDFHARYYIAARVVASMLFSSQSSSSTKQLPKFISVHLRRGDYYQHCAKVKSGKKVKEWITFSKTPATQNSLFLGRGKPFGRSLPVFSDPLSTTRHNQTIPGCYPSLRDVEVAFDEISKFTGIENIFVATNTPQDLIDAGIIGNNNRHEKNRKWRAVVLPKETSTLLFEHARKVDDVILEMVMLSLGRFFILNRFSSFSANALEMAIIHNHVKQRPEEWDNVVTW